MNFTPLETTLTLIGLAVLATQLFFIFGTTHKPKK